ncbi:MAG: hypothetical protein MK193_10020 [Lentisphaeria bacterium]|nr:hypothetical protein [Lentisphaeria bacterium]
MKLYWIPILLTFTLLIGLYLKYFSFGIVIDHTDKNIKNNQVALKIVDQKNPHSYFILRHDIIVQTLLDSYKPRETFQEFQHTLPCEEKYSEEKSEQQIWKEVRSFKGLYDANKKELFAPSIKLHGKIILMRKFNFRRVITLCKKDKKILSQQDYWTPTHDVLIEFDGTIHEDVENIYIEKK